VIGRPEWSVDNASTISDQAICQQTITIAPPLENMSQGKIWRGNFIGRRNQTRKLNFLT
jgi:hypothetical protein